jgi:DNA-binding LacI/PurR family transcriptional regulator
MSRNAAPGARRATIADVARAAGVSKAAVSFAFNSPERLGADTVERIKSIAVELGYRANPVARMLTARQTTTVGILTPRPLGEVFGNPFFALFAEGVSEVTEDQGYGLLFISPLLGSIERALDRATVDGVVVIGLEEDHPEVEAIRRAGLPIVIVDAAAWEDHGAVLVDEEEGAAAAAAHLVELGHRDVLVIALGPGEPRRATPQGVVGLRLGGYERVLGAAGIALPETHLIAASATFDSGEAAFRAAWAAGIRPSAVLAMSDAIAIGVLGAARELGLAVPADLSVVGFDDLPVSRFTDPPLTTVHQPVRRKGSEAARLLLATVAGMPAPGEQREVLATHLVVRGSTSAPRGEGTMGEQGTA